MNYVSEFGFHKERDFSLGPHVVVFPVQQKHVGTELVPIHIAIQRGVKLENIAQKSYIKPPALKVKFKMHLKHK